MKIEPATLADIPQLCILLDELFSQEIEFTPDHKLQEKGLSKILNNKDIGAILVVREESNKVIGMVNILYTISTALGGRVGILEDFVVLPEYRNRGIGSKLIGYAWTFVKTEGCKRLTLLTDFDNQDAHRFYLRNGFRCSSMVPFRQEL
jgi:GNAT superfamily N-acetyltransferase